MAVSKTATSRRYVAFGGENRYVFKDGDANLKLKPLDISTSPIFGRGAQVHLIGAASCGFPRNSDKKIRWYFCISAR